MQKTFRSCRWAAALLTLALVMSLVPMALAATTTLVLSETSLNLEVGAPGKKLTAKFSDETFPQNITWTSGDPTIATVTNGEVIAVGVGNTVITAKAGNGAQAECTVDVVLPTLRLTESLRLKINQSDTLTATLNNNVTPKNLQWKSSKPDIVEVVDGKVKVVGYDEDPVTITASADNANPATCEVTIIPPNITVNPESLEISVGAGGTRVHVETDEVIKGWGWKAEPFSSDTKVEISEQDQGDTRKEFDFTVSAPEQDPKANHINIIYAPNDGNDKDRGIVIEYTVKVITPTIVLSDEAITLTVGEEATIQAELDGTLMGSGEWRFTLTPTDLLTVVSEDTMYGSIKVKAVKNNVTNIQVEYIVNGKPAANATCTVTVKAYEEPKITGIQDFELVEGETKELTAALMPANMAGTWKWEVVNPAADGGISIDGDADKQTCKIKAAPLYGASSTAAQEVKVTFTSNTAAPAGMKNEDTKTFRVTVKQADRKVEIDPEKLELNIMQDTNAQVKVTVIKGGAPLADSNATITFNPQLTDDLGRVVAKVTSHPNGTAQLAGGEAVLTIQPVGTGEATLKVDHRYGGNGATQTNRSGVCTIVITGPSIKLDKTRLDLDIVANKNAELTATLEPSGTLANVKWNAWAVDANGAPIQKNRQYVKSDVISITHDRTGHCLIEAEKNGKALIVAVYTLEGGTAAGTVTAECFVEVGEYHFDISPDTNQMKEPGDSVTITASIRRSGKTDAEVLKGQEKNISWQLSDGTIARFNGVAPGVLQVSGKQSVTVNSRDKNTTGTVTVTATWDYTDKKGNRFFEQKSIDITYAAAEPVSFDFSLGRSTMTAPTGGDLTQTPTTGKIKWSTGKTYPVPSDFKPVYTYQTSDSKIAKVENGKVVAVGAGEATITVNGSATANGKTINADPKTYKVTVTMDTAVKSIKLSASSVSLDVGGRQTVTATTDPAGAAVTWSTSNAKVATVDNGTIVAVGPGKATITAAAGGKTAQVQVTVNGFEQLLDEITVVEGKRVSVDTIFKAHGAAEGKTPTYSSLDPTVASYANGAIVGNKVGNTSITIASGTYRFTVKVTVVADASSTIELPTMYTQTQPVLRFRDFIARFRTQAGGRLDHIVGLNVDTSKGTLYYNYTSPSEPGVGVGADNYYLSPTVGQRGIEDITFVPKPNYSGRVTINYTAVSRAGSGESAQNYVCSIVFDVDPGSGSGAGLNLSTAYNTPLKFNGADFNRVCQERLGVRLDYVTFSQPSSQQGTLYTNYVGAGNYGSVVSGSDQYTTKALDNVWFVPAPGYSGSVTVYYTGYGVGGGSFSGQVNIAVGWENNVAIGGLTYDINRGGVAYFDDFRFSSYCRQVLDSSKTLSYIRFSSLPSVSEGVLYYNYNSSSRTQATTGTNYYYSSSSPYIDRLAFAAASGFTGTVKIPFTGWTTDGVSFTGNVEINVQGGGSSGTAGDILYICGAGRTVYFDDTDFNALSRSRTGSSLNYITFTNLPSSSYGSVYYNNSRASTSTNYRNGNSTPRIDNLSFRASNSFYGAVDIPFTGRATNGETFRGVVTVATSNSAVNNGNVNASQTVFTDMAGYSASQQAAVNYLYEHNITRGMTTTQFGPQNSIRRGDFARMVYQAFDLTPSASSRPFQDVPNTAYYAQAVNALYSRGIVSGIGGGLYNPDGTLTRQDAVCMVQRAMRAVGWSADDGSINSLYRYSDGGSVSGYAQGAMAFAVDRGILPTGGSWLNPTQPLTRVDMAEIIYRVLANSGY